MPRTGTPIGSSTSGGSSSGITSYNGRTDAAITGSYGDVPLVGDLFDLDISGGAGTYPLSLPLKGDGTSYGGVSINNAAGDAIVITDFSDNSYPSEGQFFVISITGQPGVSLSGEGFPISGDITSGSRYVWRSRGNGGFYEVFDQNGNYPNLVVASPTSFGPILSVSKSSNGPLDLANYGGAFISLASEGTKIINDITSVPAGRTITLQFDPSGEVGTIQVNGSNFQFNSFNLDTRAVMLYTPDGTTFYRIMEAYSDYANVSVGAVSIDNKATGITIDAGDANGNVIPIGGIESLGTSSAGFTKVVVGGFEAFSGSSPTLAVGSSDEAISAVSVTGTDLAGTINFDVANSATTTPGTMFSIQFAQGKATVPLVFLQAANTATADDGLTVTLASISATDGTKFGIYNSTATSGPRSYALNYLVVDTQVPISGGE